MVKAGLNHIIHTCLPIFLFFQRLFLLKFSLARLQMNLQTLGPEPTC